MRTAVRVGRWTLPASRQYAARTHPEPPPRYTSRMRSIADELRQRDREAAASLPLEERLRRVFALGEIGLEAGVLAEAGVPYALIGASALSVHGVIRSSIDFHLLGVERSCLDRRTWSGLEAEGVSVEVRQGDPQDPLAGVVRFGVPDELPVDLVVGKFSWQRTLLDRAGKAVFAGVERIEEIEGDAQNQVRVRAQLFWASRILQAPFQLVRAALSSSA